MPLATPLATRAWTIAKRITVVLGSAVAILSYRYLFGFGVPQTVSANRFFIGWAVLHAVSAATALLVGPLQFVARLRRSRPGIHRAVGVTYVSACLGGGLSALPLAIGSVAGPLASAGFIGLAAAWMATTVIALQRIRRGEVAAHRRWMARSFALTLSAVTLRLYLFLSGVLKIDYFSAYPIIAWACWLPNLLAVEWYLGLSSRSGRIRQAP